MKQENEAQEKMIATLSYDLMMAQPVSKEFKTESSEHIAIKKWYEKGYWTKEMVQNAVMMNKITEEEYKHRVYSEYIEHLERLKFNMKNF